MAVILPHSCFIHVPKTGGNYVRSAIRRCGFKPPETGTDEENRVSRNHHSVFQARPYIGDRMTFGFVRHPLHWYRSFWAYRQKKGRRNSNDLDKVMHRDWLTFVRRATERYPGFLTRLYEDMLGWPTEVDYLGHTERLTEELIEALKLAGEEFCPKKLRATPQENKAASLPAYKRLCPFTPEIKRMVWRSEIEAFERYSYRRPF